MNNRFLKIATTIALFVSVTSCETKTEEQTKVVDRVFDRAEQQYTLLEEEADNHDQIPRSILNDGVTTKYLVGEYDWTQGFFPGSLWYLYEYTKDPKWEELAKEYSKKVAHNQFHKGNHDVGFIINCSFGNGLRLDHTEEYKEVLINSAKSLSSRFHPEVGVILSWDVDKGWQSERGWEYPVIIDNMMNLELLFKASDLSGDNTYRDIAIKHADKTMQHHYRPDFSSYHVVDYDSTNGEVRHRQTAQGYADNSSWARGQAWGLYGYLTCYRFTKDQKYLDFAQKIANYMLTNKSMPKDMVPYWDYNDPRIPNAPRDASAGAVTASALYELATYVPTEDAERYLENADKIVTTLSEPEFMAQVGDNNFFLLKHSVGSIPHKNEIDKPLNYADYYYLEALLRKREYEANDKLAFVID
ncbi:glycoside hydrolase family 88 protein [Flammeovirga kamogawensis]|uniref:Glycoside hydrolase family 88 protein n=1 Tax=Flammeovirga kamogawensis TaxID=373891 RepID=A0ABX8H4D7_9BACT|nr:glycoside hydrolase family 88 protein [Flammeovirga kamogawensis]MBB6461867.1 rhamnogalacturonyl hydrolase YesR [Flammeovirga kamogawensis]QWG10519.1 glycoside hydrolase family 88 protein [Flammeovirga kamogawensis]TRX63628.1 glucuronyl hydrolase [Flammeovirga kamogawensis]